MVLSVIGTIFCLYEKDLILIFSFVFLLISFIFLRQYLTPLINNAKDNSHSLSLDLYDQWQAMEKNKQWRFTPPTHVLAAFSQAIKEHKKEGGVEGRFKRYTKIYK